MVSRPDFDPSSTKKGRQKAVVHAIYGVLVKGGGMLQEVVYGGVINMNVGYGGRVKKMLREVVHI